MVRAPRCTPVRERRAAPITIREYSTVTGQDRLVDYFLSQPMSKMVELNYAVLSHVPQQIPNSSARLSYGWPRTLELLT